MRDSPKYQVGDEMAKEPRQRLIGGHCSCGHKPEIHWHGRDKYYYCAIPFCDCDGFK